VPDLPGGQKMSAASQTSGPSIELAGQKALASSHPIYLASRVVEHGEILSVDPETKPGAQYPRLPFEKQLRSSFMNSLLSLSPEGD